MTSLDVGNLNNQIERFSGTKSIHSQIKKKCLDKASGKITNKIRNKITAYKFELTFSKKDKETSSKKQNDKLNLKKLGTRFAAMG